MKKITSLVLSFAFVLTACGGPDTGNPTAMGEEVANNYKAVMQEITDLMNAGHSAEELMPKAELLKDDYIVIFVELGKTRMGYSEEDKALFDAAATPFGLLSNEEFKEFSDGQSKYRSEDLDLGNLLSSFNTLTQYAFFELLQEQNPDEVERLGLGEYLE